MPRKPKHPCCFPGCPELTESRYCEQHKKKMNSRYEKYQRDPETGHRYSKGWRSVREVYAKEHPLCEKCFEAGRIVPMAHVHHILPLSQGGTNDEENLMSLCKECHSRIHAKSGDRWHRTK